jgi:hypothetical protein
LDIAGSYVCVAGEIESNSGGDSSGGGGGDAEERWRILHSTQPELCACQLVGSGRSTDCSILRQSGEEVEQLIYDSGDKVVRRVWKVHELTGCKLPFADFCAA